MTDIRALRHLLMQVNEARAAAQDAIDRCPDPGNIIDRETYAGQMEDAGLDPVGIREQTEPARMVRYYPSFQSDEVKAYTLDPDENREWIEQTYTRYDVLRTFYKGIEKLAEERRKEMCDYERRNPRTHVQHNQRRRTHIRV